MLRLKHNKLILLLMFSCLWLSGCQSNESGKRYTTPENYMTHDNPRFNFSVDFPKAWEYQIDGTENYEATVLREANPNAGILIYVMNDPDEKIYVFGQLGTLARSAYTNTVVEDFITLSGLIGRKYTEEVQDKILINYVFDHNQLSDEGYNTRALGGSIQMRKDVYDRNKDDIELIFQSIRVTE